MLQEILKEIRRLNQNQADSLWTLEDIGAYFQLGDAATRRLTKQPNFPTPVRLPTTEKGSHPRWYAGEVKAFAKRFKTA